MFNELYYTYRVSVKKKKKHTSFTFGSNPVSLNSCIVTCGSDGDVRIWENLDDDDPKSINVGEKAYSCALKVW